MPLPLASKESTRTVVCSADPSVTLKHLPQSDEDVAAGAPKKREARTPVRWLDVNGEVDAVAPDACRVTYRGIDSDEQFETTGGLAALDKRQLGLAYQRCTVLGVCAITQHTGGGPDHIDAVTPADARKALPKLKMRWREPLGERILDESSGYADPLSSSE